MANDIPLGQDAIPLDDLPLGADAEPIDGYQNSVNVANTHLLADILKGGSKLFGSKLGETLSPLGAALAPTASKLGEQALPTGKEIPSDVLIQNLIQQSPLLAIGGGEVGAPEFITSKISKLSPLSQYVAKYLGSIGANAGLGAGLNAISGDNLGTGAALGAGTAAVTHPIATALLHGNPYVKGTAAAALGTLLGGAAGSFINHPMVSGATGGLVGALLGLRRPGFHDLAVQNVLGNLTAEQKANALARKAAGEQAGVPLTALEAIGTPAAGRQLASAGDTKAGGNLLYDFSLKRPGIETSAINDLKSMISSPENEAREQELYKSLNPRQIPFQDYTELLKDPHIFKTFEDVRDDTKNRVALKDYPVDSIKYLQYIKSDLDRQIEKEKAYGTSTGVLELEAKKHALLNAIDKSYPKFREARQLAEKRLTKQNITNSMNDAEVSAGNFYNKFLRNDDKFNALNYSLRDPNNPNVITPAQQKLQAMREAFPYILPLRTAKTEVNQANSDIKNKLNPVDLAKSLANKALAGRYNKALVNFITRPDWDSEFAQLQTIKNKSERATRMADLLSKIATTGTVSAFDMPNSQQGS